MTSGKPLHRESTARRNLAVVSIVLILLAGMGALPAERANSNAFQTLVETGFETSPTGLEGWTGGGDVTAVGPQQTVSEGGPTWVINSNGNKSGRISPNGSTQFDDALTLNLGLTSPEVTSVRAAFGGSPTDAAWIYRTVTLQSGTTYQVAWNYTSTDYEPFNDGSLTSLVAVSGTPVIRVNNSNQRWALLGFTNLGTGDYSTGSYGSTGWQVSTYEVSETGDYQLGFASFNIDDQSLSPILYIDQDVGTVTKNGAPFNPVAPNNPNAPNISTSISPGSQTISGSPNSAITSSTAFTAAGLTGTVSYAVTTGTLPAGISLNTSTGVISGTPTSTSTATVTITGTGSSSGAATATVTFAIKSAQSPLTITTVRGTVGVALALATQGGSGTGSVTYSVSNGTGSGCSVSGSNLSASAAGTCVLTATKSADATFSSVASSATTVTFFARAGAPTITGVVAASLALSVAFTAPVSDGGTSITNYRYSLDDGATYVDFSPAQTTSPLVISGLIAGTTYSVKIAAINEGGAGTASNTVTGTPIAPVSSSPGSSPTPIVTPTPTPTLTPTPRPRPGVTPTPQPTVSPTPVASPSPTPSVTATPLPSPIPGLAPVVIPQLAPTPNVVYTPSNPVPQSLVEVLLSPLAYVSTQAGEPSLPTLAPTQSLAYENGSPVVVELVRNSSQSGYVLNGDGWVVNLEAIDTAGQPLVMDESGNLILNEERAVSFSGTGFAPGSTVRVWLFSDPSELTTVLADANGNFTGTTTLPNGIPEGQHTVQLNGLSKDGQVRSIALGVVVQPDVLAASPTAAFEFKALWNLVLVTAGVVMVFLVVLLGRKRWFLLAAKRRKRDEEKAELRAERVLAKKKNRQAAKDQLLLDEVDPFLAKQVSLASPSQQFPVDSRRKLGKAAPPRKSKGSPFKKNRP